ncbi:DNA (cytosine-5-)-methyltransferase [Vitreoscilla sp. C1]|uniref:HpaII family restriction endonuclease n=1 Tax=Vitreoscilla sp. (strain C1) TaxID=96942 RepID=UPI00148EC2E2|nr:HpaII family restriction endonuclease [Vitreoscilla sp. C1]AUZ05277.2 DNA (cytosine-5-)-methyltransferase [Vitreoscilla sp. C1]
MNFIDLFAGIGGFHLALSRLDMNCVFASEIDSHAREVYKLNHKISDEIFNEDIRSISPDAIPDHDILCGGFPCQPFSQAGHKRGFDDVHKSERGNLFHYIADIIKEKRPNAFILENVRHLLKHDEGRTFQTIRDILEKELNYTVYFKIIKATDFGRPQHRPRIYIVGFNNHTVNTVPSFEFPKPTGTTMTMSDVWEGDCSREIGFTLRVGGKGSPLNDRRNWDGYLVNGQEVRLSPKEGKRMMGFPDAFQLSKSKTQAMKQLGNSVCVDVVYHVGLAVKEYLEQNQISKSESDGMANFNKGEWGELYAFLKAIQNPQIKFGDTNTNILNTNDFITVFSLQHNDQPYQYTIQNNQLIISENGILISEHNIDEILNQERLNQLKNDIVNSKATFEIQDQNILETLKINSFKGSSFSKKDVSVGFNYQHMCIENDPLGIKSFLGNNPTLLNASSNTNFIFEVNGFQGRIDDVNSIDTKNKVRDRIAYILEHGGSFTFDKCEKPTFEENLFRVDSCMPQILGNLLLQYYSGSGSEISQLITDDSEKIKIKRLLEAMLLGMFPSKLWDGNYSSNGIIVVRKLGDLLLYHTLKRNILMNYLFENTKLDTPSTSRHGFGKLIEEKNGSKFFKLNLQIRNT